MSFLTGLLGRGASAVNAEEIVVATCKSAEVLRRASAELRSAMLENEQSNKDDNVNDEDSDEIKKMKEEILKSKEMIEKELVEIRLILVGDDEKEVNEENANRLAEAALKENLLRAIARCIKELPLESSKNASHIFANLVNRRGGDVFAAQIVSEGFVLDALAKAYGENAQIALACGTMLREASRHEVVNVSILRAAFFWRFLTEYVHNTDFGIAADAFDLLRQLLTLHPHRTAGFLNDNYDFFFECYKRLLTSDNYVTCRESLRLLSDILLDRANYQTMIKYIANKDNLKIFMLLLRSKKTRIQLEAFHVFKIFVANPKKDPAITRVLFQNKEKLTKYLADFHSEKNDEQFLEERQLILDTLSTLQEDSSLPESSTPTTPPPQPASGDHSITNHTAPTEALGRPQNQR